MKRFAAFLLLFALGCGGRMTAVTFSPDNEDLAKNVSKAIHAKNMKALELAYKAAERRDASKMPNDEKEAIKWCYEQCKAGEWERAQKYMEECLASGK